MTTHRQLRRRCEKLLDELDLPMPFSLTALVANLARRRGRPLHLRALPSNPTFGGPHGLWLASENEDYIFFEEQTSHLHQEHIIFHEIGHILAHDAKTRPAKDEPGEIDFDRVQRLVPLLDPKLVRGLLERSHAPSAEEQEAEMIATLIHRRAQEPTAPSPLVGTLAELEAAMGYRRQD